MRFHIYGEKYYFKDDKISFELTQTQFEIIKQYISCKNCDKVVQNLLDGKNITQENKEKILSNVKNLINLFLSKVENVGDEIVVTGEFGKYYPRILNIELTNFCNFYCGHCYKNASNKQRQFLGINIIDYICNHYAGKVQCIHLTGGEPFSHHQVNEILEKLIDSKFLINITTNGSLYKKVSIENLKKVNNIQISLYGYDNASYEKSAKVSNFDNVKDFIRLLEYEKINFNVSFVANKDFLLNEKGYIEFFNSIKYNKFILGFADVVGRCKDNLDYWYLSKRERNKVNKILHSKLNKYKKDEQVKDDFTPCEAGTLSYSIDECGRIKLCHAFNSDKFLIGSFDEMNKRIENNKSFDLISTLKSNKDYLSNICRFKDVFN